MRLAAGELGSVRTAGKLPRRNGSRESGEGGGAPGGRGSPVQIPGEPPNLGRQSPTLAVPIVADLIARALRNRDDATAVAGVKMEAEALCARFQPYPELGA